MYVSDPVAVLTRASERGATVITNVSPFYGGYDIARFRDPWHNLWWLFAPAKPGHPAENWDEGDGDWGHPARRLRHTEHIQPLPSLLTHAETTERARAFAEGTLGKRAIDGADRAGFVVNSLLIPFVLAAIRMLESGFATASDIDEGLMRGAAHPQGPLALADLIGLDSTKAVAESLYEKFEEPLYAPPPLLSRMVDAWLLGRKTGRGFHTYA